MSKELGGFLNSGWSAVSLVLFGGGTFFLLGAIGSIVSRGKKHSQLRIEQESKKKLAFQQYENKLKQFQQQSQAQPAQNTSTTQNKAEDKFENKLEQIKQISEEAEVFKLKGDYELVRKLYEIILDILNSFADDAEVMELRIEYLMKIAENFMEAGVLSEAKAIFEKLIEVNRNFFIIDLMRCYVLLNIPIDHIVHAVGPTLDQPTQEYINGFYFSHIYKQFCGQFGNLYYFSVHKKHFLESIIREMENMRKQKIFM